MSDDFDLGGKDEMEFFVMPGLYLNRNTEMKKLGR